MFKFGPLSQGRLQVQKKAGVCLLTAAIISVPGYAANARTENTSALGLDRALIKDINAGNWKAAISQLEQKSSKQTANDIVWLSFAYVFDGRCQDLSSLLEKLKADKNSDPNSTEMKIVEAYDLTCKNKLDEAEKILHSMEAQTDKDPALDFAIAVVAGRKGQASKAIRYVSKAVELAPDFGFGYRTIGYLQQKWLKDPVKAEEAFKRALALDPDFSEVRDLMVDGHLGRNDFDGAVEIAREGIKAAPKDAGNYYRLALIYIQQWRLEEALQQLSKALTLTPSDARFHRARASILRYQGNLKEAIAEQEKAVDLSKDKAFELIELSNLESQADDMDGAARHLKQALQAEPDNQLAQQRLIQILQQGHRYQELVEEYRSAIAAKPKEAGLHIGLARALQDSGKIDEAISELKAAANLDASDPKPHRELGKIYVSQKNYEAAGKEYTRALNINPSSVEDLVALGYCYAQNQDYLQAEAAFVTAIALQQLTQPGSPAAVASRMDVLRSLAVLLLDEGRYADAASQLESLKTSGKESSITYVDQFLLNQAKALRDRSASAANNLIAIFNEMPDDLKKQYRAALIDSLLRAGKIDLAQTILNGIPEEQVATDPHLLVIKARALRIKGDNAGAEQLLKQAMNLKLDTACESESNLEMGQVLLTKGDLDGADMVVRKSIELNPRSYAAFELSGRLYLKQGDFAHAIEAGQRALELNPYYAPAYLLVGDAQTAQGKGKDALLQYKKAVELYPGWLDAHKSLLSAYRRLSLNDEAKKEAESIQQMEKQQ